MAEAAGKCHRQPPAWRTVTKEGLYQRRSGLDPWVPGDQDGVGEVQNLAEVKGPAGEHDDDKWFADGGHRAQNLELTSGQADAGDRVGLARSRRVLADEGDGDVGLVDQVHGPVAEAPVVDDGIPAQPRPYGGGWAGDVLASAVEGPGAQEGLPLVGERTGQQDAARVRRQREDADTLGVLVAEQHEGGGGRLPGQGSGGWFGDGG